MKYVLSLIVFILLPKAFSSTCLNDYRLASKKEFPEFQVMLANISNRDITRIERSSEVSGILTKKGVNFIKRMFEGYFNARGMNARSRDYLKIYLALDAAYRPDIEDPFLETLRLESQSTLLPEEFRKWLIGVDKTGVFCKNDTLKPWMSVVNELQKPRLQPSTLIADQPGAP